MKSAILALLLSGVALTGCSRIHTQPAVQATLPLFTSRQYWWGTKIEIRNNYVTVESGGSLDLKENTYYFFDQPRDFVAINLPCVWGKTCTTIETEGLQVSRLPSQAPAYRRGVDGVSSAGRAWVFG